MVNYYTKTKLIHCYLILIWLAITLKHKLAQFLYTNNNNLTFLINNFDSKIVIGSALSDYTTSAQLHTGF